MAVGGCSGAREGSTDARRGRSAACVERTEKAGKGASGKKREEEKVPSVKGRGKGEREGALYQVQRSRHSVNVVFRWVVHRLLTLRVRCGRDWRREPGSSKVERGMQPSRVGEATIHQIASASDRRAQEEEAEPTRTADWETERADEEQLVRPALVGRFSQPTLAAQVQSSGSTKQECGALSVTYPPLQHYRPLHLLRRSCWLNSTFLASPHLRLKHHGRPTACPLLALRPRESDARCHRRCRRPFCGSSPHRG